MIKASAKNLLKVTSVCAFTLSIMGGCASMSGDECLAADWNGIGFEDGAQGKALSYISRHRKACAKYGVTPDLQAYSAGHTKGVPLYCVANRAFARGSAGKSFPSLCPAAQYPEFEEAYTIGLRVHEIQREINALQKDYDIVDQELDDVTVNIQANEEQIIADGTAPETRRELMTQNKALELIASALAADLADLHQGIESLKRKKNAIRF